AEALDRNRSPLQRDLLLADGFAHAVERAARGRFLAAERTADRERLARDDTEDGVAFVHRVGVEDPRHHAPVGTDIRRGNVLLRTDLVDDLARETARHALELAFAHRLRIAHDATLRTAERNPRERALPRHPHGERLHLVERDVRVVADAALRGSARHVVRYAVSLEHTRVAVVHRNGDRDDERLFARLQHVDEVRIDREGLRDPAELRLRNVVWVLAEVRDGDFDGGHLRLLFCLQITGFRPATLLDPERDRQHCRRATAHGTCNELQQVVATW